MTNDNSEPRFTRRKMLRKVGTVSLAGTAVVSLASTPASALSKGKRVTDGGANDGVVSVFARPDATSKYLGGANGGPYNDPFGTVTSRRHRDRQANVYIWRVNWDYGGDPDGWCLRPDLAPVSTPTSEKN